MCLLLFTANTNILILLYRELKTDSKSSIFAVCRLPFAVNIKLNLSVGSFSLRTFLSMRHLQNDLMRLMTPDLSHYFSCTSKSRLAVTMYALVPLCYSTGYLNNKSYYHSIKIFFRSIGGDPSITGLQIITCKLRATHAQYRLNMFCCK